VKVRDGHQVRNKAAHLAVGVGAELRNRGVRDVLIVCCDGLTEFPEAIEATWPQSVVQPCTVHLIRAAMRFVSYADRQKVAAALKPIYTAPTIDAAHAELMAFADSDLGRRYPAAVQTWEHAWDRFIPVPRVPTRGPQDHLHHGRDRVAELPTPQDHQEPRALPDRRRGDQTALARDPRHRRQ
jgi:putative transposase